MSLRASLIFKVVISEQEVRLSKAMQLREQNLSSCSWQHNSPEGARFCHVDFCWCPLQSTMQNLSLFSSIAKAHLKYSLWHKYSKSPALLMLLQLFAPEQIPNVADLIFFPFSRWCKQAPGQLDQSFCTRTSNKPECTKQPKHMLSKPSPCFKSIIDLQFTSLGMYATGEAKSETRYLLAL